MTREQLYELNRKVLSDGIKILMKEQKSAVKMSQDTLSLFAGLQPYQISKFLNMKKDYNPRLQTISYILSAFDMTLGDFYRYMDELEDRE
jgi:transcriptional regulator with XRE-family HTH domain